MLLLLLHLLIGLSVLRLLFKKYFCRAGALSTYSRRHQVKSVSSVLHTVQVVLFLFRVRAGATPHVPCLLSPCLLTDVLLFVGTYRHPSVYVEYRNHRGHRTE